MLSYYFGPGGVWWDTEHVEASTQRLLRSSARPGEVPELSPEELQD
jgi:hypothetical protein